jgi:hypothetical protein
MKKDTIKTKGCRFLMDVFQFVCVSRTSTFLNNHAYSSLGANRAIYVIIYNDIRGMRR